MERQGWGWKVRQGLGLVCVSPTRNTLEAGLLREGGGQNSPPGQDRLDSSQCVSSQEKRDGKEAKKLNEKQQFQLPQRNCRGQGGKSTS